MNLVIYITYKNYTFMSAFYPQFANNLFGVAETLVGFIFGIQALASFITSLIIGKYMT